MVIFLFKRCKIRPCVDPMFYNGRVKVGNLWVGPSFMDMLTLIMGCMLSMLHYSKPSMVRIRFLN